MIYHSILVLLDQGPSVPRAAGRDGARQGARLATCRGSRRWASSACRCRRKRLRHFPISPRGGRHAARPGRANRRTLSPRMPRGHPAACRKAVLAPDRDAPGGADHALALAWCRVTAAKAKAKAKVAEATVDDSVDPERRRHCDHQRPSGEEPVARHPAKLGSFRKHSFNRDRGRSSLTGPLPHHPACGSAPGGSRS